MKNTESSKSDIKIPIGDIYLNGILCIPKNARGIVLFVHGSGSSRFSLRNQYVADFFNKADIATLLFDLLTPDEETVDKLTREYRFNIELLASRLIAVTDWVSANAKTSQLKIGYFGSSTGGAAALLAAANMQTTVKAVVSRGGRPDLAGDVLSNVISPTLLIVGENDETVIQLNEDAMA